MKIKCTLAISLDGYIADEHGGYDWIMGDGHHAHDTEKKWDFEEFMKDIDIVVMGRNCYDQDMHKSFEKQQVMVITSRPLNDDTVTVLSENIESVLLELKKTRNIFIFGGGHVVSLLRDIIDEYAIGIVPVILGNGIPLFHPSENRVKLKFEGMTCDEGIVVLSYTRNGVNHGNQT